MAEDTQSKKWFLNKETLLAVAALLFSIYNFWFANLHVIDKAAGRVAEADGPAAGNGNAIVLKVAFFDSGNRNAVIMGASYTLLDQQQNQYGDPPVYAGNPFPLLLLPHDIRVVAMTIPAADVTRHYGNADPCTGGSGCAAGGRMLKLRLNYYAIDSVGREFYNSSDPQLVIGMAPISGQGAAAVVDEVGALQAKGGFEFTSLLK
jgi:hypothetical protein